MGEGVEGNGEILIKGSGGNEERKTAEKFCFATELEVISWSLKNTKQGAGMWSYLLRCMVTDSSLYIAIISPCLWCFNLGTFSVSVLIHGSSSDLLPEVSRNIKFHKKGSLQQIVSMPRILESFQCWITWCVARDQTYCILCTKYSSTSLINSRTFTESIQETGVNSKHCGVDSLVTTLCYIVG